MKTLKLRENEAQDQQQFNEWQAKKRRQEDKRRVKKGIAAAQERLRELEARQKAVQEEMLKLSALRENDDREEEGDFAGEVGEVSTSDTEDEMVEISDDEI